MLFTVVSSASDISRTTADKNLVYLIEDDWNDWWEFKTMYSICYVDQEGKIRHIGSVKIGEHDMGKDQKRPNLPIQFERLSDKFFSIGQDVSYYEDLNTMGDDYRHLFLSSLKDMALLPQVYDSALRRRVTKVSLLRDVRHTSVIGQYRRLANGNAKLTPFHFSYTGPNIAGSERIKLSFEVEPESNPPTNIHILIGRNAVGKTHLINNMINSLILKDASPNKVGFFAPNLEVISREELFANIVSVSFSAFDPMEPLAERKDKTEGIPYSYVGLKQIKKANQTTSPPPKSPDNLKYEFANSLHAIKSSNKTTRWLRAVDMLTSDPIFEAADVPSILETDEADDGVFDFFETNVNNDKDNQEYKEADLLKRKAQKFFHRLSSGHKIVLLTLTRLVETVEERTLVFLDEPEAHLHPPLLSAFIRALSDLLIQRNAVAIIATHSPVILQEVPRSCVWKLRRRGIHTSYGRTEIETFGESVGALTREIFELEVTYSGYYKMLREAVSEIGDYDLILEHFNNELGMEARTLIRALLADEKREEG